MPKTIILRANADSFIRKEAEASSAILPGELVEFGGINELQAHGTDAGIARKAFALENDLIGKGIDDAYAAGETVQYAVCSSGTEIYAFLNGGENVAKGAALVSAGEGSLRAVGSEPEDDVVVAFALEALNISSQSAGDDSRLKVEVA